MSGHSFVEAGDGMRFTILTVMLMSVAAALTFGARQAGEGTSAYFFYASISLFMTSTLAMPLICDRRAMPFWAGYATTTAYALLIRGRDVDPFTNCVLLPFHYMFGDLTSLSDQPVAEFIAFGLQMWMPALLGLISGVMVATCVRLSRRHPATQ